METSHGSRKIKYLEFKINVRGNERKQRFFIFLFYKPFYS